MSAKRLDGVVGEWGSADRSRSAELQFAAPVVRLGPARRAPRRGVQGGDKNQFRLAWCTWAGVRMLNELCGLRVL
jgi:hypothetical protein